MKKRNTTYIADEKEYIKRLSEKLEELADIIEVLEAIIKTKNISKNELETIRLKKRKERGSFDKRIVLIDKN